MRVCFYGTCEFLVYVFGATYFCISLSVQVGSQREICEHDAVFNEICRQFAQRLRILTNARILNAASATSPKIFPPPESRRDLVPRLGGPNSNPPWVHCGAAVAFFPDGMAVAAARLWGSRMASSGRPQAVRPPLSQSEIWGINLLERERERERERDRV